MLTDYRGKSPNVEHFNQTNAKFQVYRLSITCNQSDTNNKHTQKPYQDIKLSDTLTLFFNRIKHKINGNMSKSDNKLFLTIDQGGHASRALIFNTQGTVIANASQAISAKKYSTEISTGNSDFAEYDPEEIISSIQAAIESAITQAQNSHADNDVTSDTTNLNIVAAGLATQRSNIVCWNKKTGAALSPVISWQDHRALPWLQQFDQQKDFIHQKTGLPLSSHYGAGKLHWCLKHIPEVHQAFKNQQLAFGPMASFIAFRLLDENPFLCDPTNASRTQLMNIESLNWDKDLLKLFDIPLQALPKIVNTRSNFGTLKICGLTIPASIMTGDLSAAFYAQGQPDSKTASVTLGTGAFIQQTTTQKYNKNLLSSIVYADKEHTQYNLEATINGAGSALEYVAYSLDIHDYPSQFSDWLEECGNPPLFLNGIGGLGTPYLIANFNSRFIGDSNNENKMVAVIESIIFLIMTNLDIMQKLPDPPQKITIGGGLSQLDTLCQKLSDLSRLPVSRLSNSETTCLGLAYLLSENTLTMQHKQTLFRPKKNSPLLNRYQCWQQAMNTAINE